DPYWAVVIPFDLTKAYEKSKQEERSFFSIYLHACMKAINEVENFKYRIIDDKIVIYDVIHASATILRANNTFACSYIEYDNELEVFERNLMKEKQRIENSNALFPPNEGIDCIYCSAMPWFNFTGHKEPFSGAKMSVPMLAFSALEQVGGKRMMNVSISVNHALVDGYHMGLFSNKFQNYLNT
ncbi:MAG: chloramphenicol acetyltransferase, partial [Bacteroidia bacterium]|nr:chloramphenicol acetyltransferase [Bacteroidia bacterium]